MNKAERIKAEVERRLSDCGYAMGSENSPIIAKILYESYRSLLLFINSLEEEPVSEDLEKACDEYYDETWDEHGGKAMVVDGCHDIWFPSQATDDFFKAGAKWQKEQMIEKAWNWIEDNLLSSNQQDKSRLYFEQFKNYIKE